MSMRWKSSLKLLHLHQCLECKKKIHFKLNFVHPLQSNFDDGKKFIIIREWGVKWEEVEKFYAPLKFFFFTSNKHESWIMSKKFSLVKKFSIFFFLSPSPNKKFLFSLFLPLQWNEWEIKNSKVFHITNSLHKTTFLTHLKCI